MEINESFADEYELPRNRKKRILSDLDDIDAQDDALLMSTQKTEKKKEKDAEEENVDTWITSLGMLSNSKIKSTRSAKNLFGSHKKKKKKKKEKGEATDFSKEFEPEVALINNLLIDQTRFVDSLQKQYDMMSSSKATARGMGKFTTDLIENINTARQLSSKLIGDKIGVKKTIADLEMKQRKELGAGASGDDLNNYAAEYLRNILTNRPDMMNAYGDISVDDADEDGLLSSIDNNVNDERGDEVNSYLKYENRGVRIFVEMDQDDPDDYDFVAQADDGEILLDYPLPDHTTLSLNRSTMTATDAFGKKYHVEFRNNL